jgi:uncharacterized protein with NRDE domain
MCTLIILHRIREDRPVIIAANRDELYARPARPPERLLDDPLVVGGVDAAAGGTWLGVTRDGLLASLTNQHPSQPPDRSRRSRGGLVIDALRQTTTERVLDMLRATDPRAYNPFNLVFGDARGLWAAYARDDSPELEIAPIADGLQVLANDRLDSPEFPRVARVRELVEPVLGEPWPILRAHLIAALADHGGERPVCVHTAAYGTRSSSLVALVPGGVDNYEHADGSPCTTPFRDVKELLQ